MNAQERYDRICSARYVGREAVVAEIESVPDGGGREFMRMLANLERLRDCRDAAERRESQAKRGRK